MTSEELRECVRAASDLDLSDAIYGPAAQRHGGYIDHPMPYYQVLAGLCRRRRVRRVLEVGTHFGGSTLAMLAGMKAASHSGDCRLTLVTLDVVRMNERGLARHPEIFRIDGSPTDPDTVAAAKQRFDTPHVDLLYIDALKSRHFVGQALAHITQCLVPGLLVLDDIAMNASMQQLWREVVDWFGADKVLNVSELDPSLRAPDIGFGIVDVEASRLPVLLPSYLRGTAHAALAKAPWRRRTWSAELPPRWRDGIKPREGKVLQFLSSRYYSGEGAIVDHGCDEGHASIVMAAGLQENEQVPDVAHRLTAYGAFRSMPEAAPGSPPSDQDPAAALSAAASALGSPINIVRSTVLSKVGWTGQPIELLVSGSADSRHAIDALAREFLPRLIAGRGVWVIRDFGTKNLTDLDVLLGGCVSNFDVLDYLHPMLVLGLRRSLVPAQLAGGGLGASSMEAKSRALQMLAQALPLGDARACVLVKQAGLLWAGTSEDRLRSLAAELEVAMDNVESTTVKGWVRAALDSAPLAALH